MGSVLLVPFGRRRVMGVVVEVAESSELPPERLAEPIEALAAGATPELVQLGLWVAREYCSTPARGLELVLPPRVGAGGRAGRDRGWRRLPAPPRPAGPRLATGRGSAGASAPRSRGWPARDAAVELSAGKLEADGVDRQTLGRLEARGLVSLRVEQRLRRPRVVDVGARSSRPALSAEQRAALEAVVAAMDGAAQPRAPAARGHRLREDGGLPGGHRGGARAGKGRDRAGSRDRADAPGDLALCGALRRPRGAAPLAAGGRRAPRRVAAAALR